MNRRPAPSATISRLPRSRVLGLLLDSIPGLVQLVALTLWLLRSYG